MNNSNNLACFLRDRIFLIDIVKRDHKSDGKGDIVFIIEEYFKNHEVSLDSNSLKCSCKAFQNKISVCRHIKFILEKIDQVDNKKSKSCSEIGTFNKMFYVDIGIGIKANINLNKFKCDYNPRYKEYKILQDTDYNGICCICLDKLSKKIIRCKHCNKYYHEQCIYGWLRYGPACTCPNCKGQWL